MDTVPLHPSYPLTLTLTHTHSLTQSHTHTHSSFRPPPDLGPPKGVYYSGASSPECDLLLHPPLHPSLSSRLLPHPVNLSLSPSLCLITVMYFVCVLHFERLQRENYTARCSTVSTSNYEMFPAQDGFTVNLTVIKQGKLKNIK